MTSDILYRMAPGGLTNIIGILTLLAFGVTSFVAFTLSVRALLSLRSGHSAPPRPSPAP